MNTNIKITKKDIGKEILHNSTGMLAKIAVIVDNKPWCRFNNGGATGVIVLDEWKYLNFEDIITSIYDEYETCLNNIYLKFKKEFKVVKKLPVSKPGKVIHYFRAYNGDAYALVLNNGDNKKLWRYRSIYRRNLEVLGRQCSNMEEFIQFVAIKNQSNYK